MQQVHRPTAYISMMYNSLSCRLCLICRMIQQHRSDLENDIYAEGIEHVRRLLCTDFTSLCPMHALYDTGEL